jgi:hypothetical protein
VKQKNEARESKIDVMQYQLREATGTVLTFCKYNESKLSTDFGGLARANSH